MDKVLKAEHEHTFTEAPYVRKCCIMFGRKREKISKFDLRFVQPGEEEYKTETVDLLEYLLSKYLGLRLDGMIDVFSMESKTGFFLLMEGDRDPDEIKDGLEKALRDIMKLSRIPDLKGRELENRDELSLDDVQKCIEKVLETGFSLVVLESR